MVIRTNCSFLTKESMDQTANLPPKRDKSMGERYIHRTLLRAIASNTKFKLFSCSACDSILRHPVTIKCGHTMCLNCLDRADTKCHACSLDIGDEPFRINVLVQNLIEKWKERNRIEEMDSPVFRLLVRPRYQLRSRSAGLQCSVDIRRRHVLKRRRKHQGFQIDLRQHPNEKRRCRLKPKSLLDRKVKEGQIVNESSFHKVLQNVLNDLQITIENALRANWTCITEEDLECMLCRSCLVDPVTTPCGHTFCRDCLTRVLDHRLTCPLCVSRLSVGDYFRATTIVLDEATQFLFPKLNGKRPSRSDNVPDQNFDVPVFVCTNAFPGVACPLYVNEPRYRLLIRRCLQNSPKTFAMASSDPCGAKFMQYGTVLEVRDAVALEDGRIILSTQGIRRFRVINRSEKDGYDTAKIEHIRDTRPKQEDVSDLVSLHKKVYTRAVKWIHLLSSSALSEVERLIGPMPTVERDWIDLPDGPSWTWWLIPILPLSSHLQVGFLSSTSLEKRLRAIDKMLEHMKIRMKAVPRAESVAYAREEDDAVEFCGE